jgi:hypothetical protein
MYEFPAGEDYEKSRAKVYNSDYMAPGIIITTAVYTLRHDNGPAFMPV